ncbi:Protein of unknown function [Gryllus bimaculatus]|nr:Protein of unknown function [Gryllus bimaculatus]
MSLPMEERQLANEESDSEKVSTASSCKAILQNRQDEGWAKSAQTPQPEPQFRTWFNVLCVNILDVFLRFSSNLRCSCDDVDLDTGPSEFSTLFNISHKSTDSLPRHNRLWRMASSCVQSVTAWPMLIAWAGGGCSQPDKEVRPDRRGGTGLGEVRIPRPPSRAGATEDAL